MVIAPDTPTRPPPYAPPNPDIPGIYPTIRITGGTLQIDEGEGEGSGESASQVSSQKVTPQSNRQSREGKNGRAEGPASPDKHHQPFQLRQLREGEGEKAPDQEQERQRQEKLRTRLREIEEEKKQLLRREQDRKKRKKMNR